MVGSPIKRARRLAREAALAKSGVPPQDAPHTIPSVSPTPRIPDVGWVEHKEPTRRHHEPEADIDPFVASVMPQPDGPTSILDATKDKLYTELVGLALDRALDIMRLKPGDDNYDKQVLTRQASIIASVLSTTARIDEARLKGRGRDKVSELLEEIRRLKPGMN